MATRNLNIPFYKKQIQEQIQEARAHLKAAINAFQTERTLKNARTLEHYRQVCPGDTHFTPAQTTLLNEAYRMVFMTK